MSGEVSGSSRSRLHPQMSGSVLDFLGGRNGGREVDGVTSSGYFFGARSGRSGNQRRSPRRPLRLRSGKHRALPVQDSVGRGRHPRLQVPPVSSPIGDQCILSGGTRIFLRFSPETRQFYLKRFRCVGSNR